MQEPCNDSGSIFANMASGHLGVILILILQENCNQRERNTPRSLKEQQVTLPLKGVRMPGIVIITRAIVNSFSLTQMSYYLKEIIL